MPFCLNYQPISASFLDVTQFCLSTYLKSLFHTMGRRLSWALYFCHPYDVQVLDIILMNFTPTALQYNDNNGNPYSDVFWVSALVQSIGELEFGQQVCSQLFFSFLLSALLSHLDKLEFWFLMMLLQNLSPIGDFGCLNYCFLLCW